MSQIVNPLFRLSCWNPSDNLSQDGQDYHIWNNFNFFLCYNLTALAKQTLYPTDSSTPPTPLKASASSPAEDLASSFSSAFMPESPSASLLSTVGNQPVKVQLPFNFWKGNKFPDVWEWVMLKPPVVWSLGVEDLWLLHIFPTSRLLGAGQSIQWCAHCQLYGPTFIGIWGSGPCRSNLASSPLCAPVGSFLYIVTGVFGPAVTNTLRIQLHSLLILSWGNRAPYLGYQMSLLSHNACPMSGGHHSR